MPRKHGKSTSSAQLPALVANLRSAHSGLILQRTTVDSQITAIENALRALQVSPGGGRISRAARGAGKGGGRRGIRPGSLTDRVQKILASNPEPMRVMEITAAVRRGGFKTKNKTLDKSVGITLRNLPGIVRAGRGLYSLG